MSTQDSDEIDSNSIIRIHLEKPHIAILGAFILEPADNTAVRIKGQVQAQRERNLERLWKLKTALQNLGHTPIMLEAKWVENKERLSALYFFVLDLSFDEAVSLGEQFDQYAVLARTSDGQLASVSTNPKSGIGKILHISESTDTLDTSLLLKAFTDFLRISRSDHEIHHIVLEELTRVPLHCSHSLEYPYLKCYTFTETATEREI